MEVHVAYCHHPRCRGAVVPSQKGKCPTCEGDLELLSNVEDITRMGIRIPSIFLISMGGNGKGTLKLVHGSSVPPDLET